METGQKTIQPNSNKHTRSIYTLSIQVSLNGLSFCILNSKDKSVDYYNAILFESRLTPHLLLEKLISQLNSEAKLQKDFEEIVVIHENELSSLVPNALFDKNHLADYLKFNSRILKTDYINYDIIKSNDSVNVYVPYVNINNYLYDQFGEFKYLHFSTVLIEKLLEDFKDVKANTAIIHVAKGHFEIIVINFKGLRLFNSFEYRTKEDFIYYILFTLEQLQLDPESIEIKLIGEITENDELYKVMYSYIRHVSFISAITKFAIPEEYKGVLQNYSLLNSL